jgi:hypothetical protein
MEDQSTAVLAHLMKLATRYSGRQAQPGDRIYGDLNINGGDFMEFVVEIERHYGVDLSSVSPTQSGAKAQDPTIEDLAKDVHRQQG